MLLAGTVRAGPASPHDRKLFPLAIIEIADRRQITPGSHDRENVGSKFGRAPFPMFQQVERPQVIRETFRISHPK